jgi:Zn-dependent metalloprotease
MSNGLRTFAFHSTQAPTAAASLRPEVAVSAARDATGHTDLSMLDAENVARRYLDKALASAELGGFTVSEVNGQPGEFKSLGVEKLLLTNTQTVKFRQFYRKIPVYGSLITIELDESNELLSISSAMGEPANVDPVASLSAAQALTIVREQAGYKPTQYLDAHPGLHYYFDQQVQRWRLVYIIEDVSKQRTAQDDPQALTLLPEIVDYVIDAHSGEVVAELPRTQTVEVVSITDNAQDGLGDQRQFIAARDNGTKFLLDQTHNVHTFDFEFRDTLFEFRQLPGKYVRNPPEPWNEAGISAHANSVLVVQFLKEVLMRDGLDNQGGRIVSSVNCLRFGASQGQEWKNAARIPGQMIYGQRLVNGKLVSYAVTKDVVAHELLHGLTDHTARLEYRVSA